MSISHPKSAQCGLWRTLAPLAAVLIVLLSGHGLFAQSIQGSIIGTVKDTAGAVVPGASVVLTSLDQGTVRTTTSNDSGDFQFGDSKAGKYSIEVTLAGFEKWSTSGLVLTARQQLRVDPSLAVGNVQQEVTVSADAIGVINTETPTVSASYSAIEASNLPINTRASSNGTSPLSIIGTLPGVQEDHNQFSVQGALPFQSEITVDGITVKNSGGGDNPIKDALPSTEGISEIRVDGAQNNAEFALPGEVTFTTKGGTNKIHGSAFWYHQNAAFNAIPYTFVTTTKKTKLVANTYGGSFAGPVVIPHLYNGHDKSFFFADYEGWRHPSQETDQYKVPSTLMKQGDFSKYSSTGFTGLTNPFTGGSYGTKLPAVNSAAAKLLSLYPDPNIGDPTAYSDDDTPNYQVNKDTSAHSDQFDVRGDQYFGSNQKFLLWGRYSYKNYPTNSAEPLAVPSAVNTNINHVVKISANYSITPKLINEFSFGFVRSNSGKSNSFDGKTFTQGLGLNGLQNLFYNGIPELDFNNISHLDADRISSVGSSKTYVFANSLTWNKGHHDMRFGFEIRTLESVSALGFNGSDNYGTFQYNTKASAGLFTGVDFADFLSGLPYQTFYDVVSQDNDGKSNHYDFFAQDQWKLNNRLTLSYGLRYELHPGYYDVHGDIGNFDPTVSKSGASIYPDGHADLLNNDFLLSANACTPYGSKSGGATINGAPCMPVLTASQGGYPAGLKKYPHLRFMPRFGFAYKPFNDDKTAIRGGYGIYNNNLLGSSFYSLTGTLQAGTTQYTNTLDQNTHAIGYQWPNIFAGAGNGGGATNYGQDYFGTANSIDWKDPYTHQWSLSVDHSFGSGYAARVSYIGSETIHLVFAPDENTLPFSNTVSANDQPFSARLFPNWGRINTRDTSATSSYHSLQAELSHRFQHGFQFDSSYTYAKALADNEGPGPQASFSGENGGNRATSILDKRADFGDVYGTRRNRWNTTMVYELPFGRGKQFGTNISRFADLAFGGWRISNIFLWQSGAFYTPYYGSGQGDPSGTGTGLNGTTAGWDGGHRSQYPDRVAGVSIKPTNRSRNGWVSNGAFTCPGLPSYVVGSGDACLTGVGTVKNADGTSTYYAPIGRFGNARQGSIVGPGTVDLSTGLSKVFKITEGVNLRAEGTFNNVLNHTNLGDPNLDISSKTFGRISSAIAAERGGARTGQVSMRLDF